MATHDACSCATSPEGADANHGATGASRDVVSAISPKSWSISDRTVAETSPIASGGGCVAANSRTQTPASASPCGDFARGGLSRNTPSAASFASWTNSLLNTNTWGSVTVSASSAKPEAADSCRNEPPTITICLSAGMEVTSPTRAINAAPLREAKHPEPSNETWNVPNAPSFCNRDSAPPPFHTQPNKTLLQNSPSVRQSDCVTQTRRCIYTHDSQRFCAAVIGHSRRFRWRQRTASSAGTNRSDNSWPVRSGRSAVWPSPTLQLATLCWENSVDLINVHGLGFAPARQEMSVTRP